MRSAATARDSGPRLCLLAVSAANVPLQLDRFVAMALLLVFGRCGMASEAQRVWTHEIEARVRVDLQHDAHVVASLVDCLARSNGCSGRGAE